MAKIKPNTLTVPFQPIQCIKARDPGTSIICPAPNPVSTIAKASPRFL